MAILNKLEKQTDNKFLNMYKANFTNKAGKDFDYFIVSRRDNVDNLSCKTGMPKCDAVSIIPFFENDDLVLIKQFRPAVNAYLFEFPAGLVDKGETVLDAVTRELKEETGLDVEDIAPFVAVPSYNSAGMTDEALCIYAATVKGNPSLDFKEENEDIEIIILKKNDIRKFLNEHTNIALKTRMILEFLCILDNNIK